MKNIFILNTLTLWIIYIFSKIVPRNKYKVVFGIHTQSFSANVKTLGLGEKINTYLHNVKK